MPACIVPIRFSLFLLPSCSSFDMLNAICVRKHSATWQTLCNTNKRRRAQKNTLKLSQRAEGIWKQCRHKRCRSYQMNVDRKYPNVNVTGERERINWHESDMHDSSGVATVKHAPTYDRKNTTNINTLDKEWNTRGILRECGCGARNKV